LTRGDVTPKQKGIPINRGRSSSRTRTQVTHTPSDSSYSSLYGHPAATRASLVQTAADIASARSPSPSRATHGRLSFDTVSSPTITASAGHPGPHTPLSPAEPAIAFNEDTPLLDDTSSVVSHDHGHAHGHGHSHGSMNMQALLLHVLGDALGNVGVIATGLIIWQTTWEYKYYCDPVISLIITVIIFSSALPLGDFVAFTLLRCYVVRPY
jgi:zinc transporter 1